MEKGGVLYREDSFAFSPPLAPLFTFTKSLVLCINTSMSPKHTLHCVVSVLKQQLWHLDFDGNATEVLGQSIQHNAKTLVLSEKGANTSSILKSGMTSSRNI